MPGKDLRELRAKLEKHLEESGEIRNDLVWIKKAFWTLAAAGITFNVSFIVGILLYVIKR